MLKVRGALEPQQVRAIRHLVASAVNGLKPERVSIVDETGRLLADGAGRNADIAVGRRAPRRFRAPPARSGRGDRLVGRRRRPRACQLTADFDFNRITQTSDRYDPESRVVRSSQTREENSHRRGQEGQVTVDNELPGGQRRRRPARPPSDQS